MFEGYLTSAGLVATMLLCACGAGRTGQVKSEQCFPEPPDRAPVLRLARMMDSVAADQSRGRLVVLIDSSTSRRPVADAYVALPRPAPPTRATLDTTGRLMLDAQAGERVLRILAMG